MRPLVVLLIRGFIVIWLSSLEFTIDSTFNGSLFQLFMVVRIEFFTSN